MTAKFLAKDPSKENVWRSIILLGRNEACYKFSLAKTLLELPSNVTNPSMEDLALPFALNICSHLERSPKQITKKSSTFLDYCKKFNKGEIREDELTKRSRQLGFTRVIDHFHNVAGGRVPISFFEDHRSQNKSVALTDEFLSLKSSVQISNILDEVDSRWNLWEAAIGLGFTPHPMIIKSQDGLLGLSGRRLPITNERGALMGYQRGSCFYCGRFISTQVRAKDVCHVDHVFPRDLWKKTSDPYFYQVEAIWNHVLSCSTCNGSSEKTNKIPSPWIVERLLERNNYYVESHHPLKQTIIAQTGSTEAARTSFLQTFLNRALEVIPVSWGPREHLFESP